MNEKELEELDVEFTWVDMTDYTLVRTRRSIELGIEQAKDLAMVLLEAVKIQPVKSAIGEIPLVIVITINEESKKLMVQRAMADSNYDTPHFIFMK